MDYILDYVVHDDGIVEVYVRYANGLWKLIAFDRPEALHEFVSGVISIDKIVNPQLYTHEKWSGELLKVVTDALK